MCQQTDPERDPYGCHGELPEGRGLDASTGKFPFPVRECPFRVLRSAAADLGEIFRLCRDHDAGVLTNWPDGYTGAASDAVYYVLENRDAALAAASRLS